MASLSRRNFLCLSASAAYSMVYADPFAGFAGTKLRTGLIGWEPEIQRTLTVLSDIPQFRLAALCDVSDQDLPQIGLLSAKSKSTPPNVCRSQQEMMRHHPVDVVLTSRTPSRSASVGAQPHMILQGAAAESACNETPARSSAICVQILPRNEFIGRMSCAVGSGFLSAGHWTKAQIRHLTAQPMGRDVQNEHEFAQWLWAEIGESVDFANEMLGSANYQRISAMTSRGLANGGSSCAIRFQEAAPVRPKAIEVAIHTTGSPRPPQPKTEIALSGGPGSITFRAAVRSDRSTRLLLTNLSESVRQRDPSRLLNPPAALKASYDLVAAAVAQLFAVS